jgi:mannose-1-phosphate guanylyltransferase/mannose-6-phosphate isomerase
MQLYSVILAGGGGTRLWPISNSSKPKQFLSLDNQDTLFNQTLKRNNFIPNNRIIIVTGSKYLSPVDENLSKLDSTDIKDGVKIIVEPKSKNTAPAITAAALAIYDNDRHSIMLVAPSDHVITDTDCYEKNIKLGISLAKEGNFVTFGIKPDSPDINYGYIKRGEYITDKVFKAKTFIEKPSQDKANEYCNADDFYRNSGIFIFSVQAYIDAISFYEPKMQEQIKKSLRKAKFKDNKIFLDPENFNKINPNSIDYALIERISDIIIIEADFSCHDIGTWKGLWNAGLKDNKGNILSDNTFTFNTRNSLINSGTGKFIAAVDLENVSIIETNDAILVVNNETSYNVKHVVTKFTANDYPKFNSETKFEKYFIDTIKKEPWGCFDTIKTENNYLIKKITISPKQKLSLQFHQHRSEHWIVVKGTGEVTVGTHIKILKEDEYVYIPKQAKHRLTNIGDDDLVLIEIQIGNILKESDIVRLKDLYGRA